MRPVNKGDAPQTYVTYGEAMNDLRGRIGNYCSYCERPLLNPEIEHVIPKNPETGDPSKELDWDNFLLACKNCNTSKGSASIDVNDYIWPDRDNTAYAYIYEQGRIHIRRTLTEGEQNRAQALLELVGLDKLPTISSQKVLLNPTQFVGKPISKSLGTSWDRWRDRYQAWEDANEALKTFEAPADRDKAISSLLKIIEHQGHWSTYAQVFTQEKDVMEALLSHDSFPGTAKDCFQDSELGKRPIEQLNRPVD